MRPTAFAAAVAFTLPLMTTVSVKAATVSTEDFVNKVAISDMFEVQSGKLASEKAKNEDVQGFGEQMVEDHTETTEDLKELVKDEDIKVEFPTALDNEHKSKLDKLNGVSGDNFDKAYIPMQVMAHESAVNLFEDYSKSGDNEELKEWAADTLPTLKEHLEEARELNQELSKPAKTAAKDEKTLSKQVTEETDVNGTDNMAMNEKDRAEKKQNAQTAENKAATPPSFEYVTAQAPTDWTAQALIGRSVRNNNNETLGEINNVILNEKGKVVAVTIGVGGFLGIGEKDVGVPFEALKFRHEDAVENDADNDASDDDTAEVDDPSHSDMVIVVDATKEQLEAAPNFVWLGDKREKRAETDAESAVD